MREKLGWQLHLHNHSKRWILMATKRTKPGSEDRATVSQLVLNGMRSGLSAFKACKQAGVNQSTFNDWLNDDTKLAADYARAREDLLEMMASDLLDIADRPVGSIESGATDSGAVADKKVQIDTRKWLLSKLAPKKYGDKLELSGDPANPLVQRIERVVVKA
jgi:hypothetical protein